MIQNLHLNLNEKWLIDPINKHDIPDFNHMVMRGVFFCFFVGFFFLLRI